MNSRIKNVEKSVYILADVADTWEIDALDKTTEGDCDDEFNNENDSDEESTFNTQIINFLTKSLICVKIPIIRVMNI